RLSNMLLSQKSRLKQSLAVQDPASTCLAGYHVHYPRAGQFLFLFSLSIADCGAMLMGVGMLHRPQSGWYVDSLVTLAWAKSRSISSTFSKAVEVFLKDSVTSILYRLALSP
ncbi:hypothetical protein CHS0354_001214, partial [Potamilus streckersoni]